MRLVTRIDAFSHEGVFLWTVRTRRDLEQRLGHPVYSRNEDRRRWNVLDPAGLNSLCGVDESSSRFPAKIQLCCRLEKVRPGNARQRRAARRATR